jgi:O-antigen chain-terminating methyltransferase
VYLPFIEQVKKIRSECKAIDLGCGRGEWLELMREIGVQAHGVDTNKEMLEACEILGLSIEMGDALNYLSDLKTESIDIVSGFHIIEHLKFDSVHEMIHHAIRVLRPAGLLILETPNPENIVVATSSFYMDPTHQKPIPPQLLRFMAEYYGFCRVKVLRLQEETKLYSIVHINLKEVLTGVSPDYAVVCQKNSDQEELDLFNKAFSISSGISLNEAIGKYDAYVNELVKVQSELASVYSSQSWRITAPLRFGKTIIRNVINKFRKLVNQKTLGKNGFRYFLKCAINVLDTRPRLKAVAYRIVSKFPRLKSRLRRIMISYSAIKKSSLLFNNVKGVEDLPPTAKRVYEDLKDVLRERERKR